MFYSAERSTLVDCAGKKKKFKWRNRRKRYRIRWFRRRGFKDSSFINLLSISIDSELLIVIDEKLKKLVFVL